MSMAAVYRVDRVAGPDDRPMSRIVVNEGGEPHPEGCAFLDLLRAARRSFNTERMYAGRVALYLSWCVTERLDWKRFDVDQMQRFRQWLVTEPVAGHDARISTSRHRSPATANAILSTACEFLEFCVQHDLAEAELSTRLPALRGVRLPRTGHRTGPRDEATGAGPRSSAPGSKPPTAIRRPYPVAELLAAATNARDRFLVALVLMARARIAEVLSLRRADVHLLPDSRGFGCPVTGPHLHAHRCVDGGDTSNRPRLPRLIPVPHEVVPLYAAYMHERDLRLGVHDRNPAVFVNLYRPPLGEQLSRQNVRAILERLARSVSSREPSVIR